MSRLILLLLVAALALWAAGKWRRQPKVPQRRSGPAVQAASKCPDCGAYVLGTAPEPCARPDCRYR